MHKKQKEHLFDNAIRGIIESVENISKHKLLEKGLICMGKTDHNAHSVYLMYYHLIMVVKYRRKVIADGVTGSEDLFDKFWIAFQKCADDEERCRSLMFRKSFQNSRCISIFITGIESKVDYLFAGVLCVKGIKFFQLVKCGIADRGIPIRLEAEPPVAFRRGGNSGWKEMIMQKCSAGSHKESREEKKTDPYNIF